MSLANPKILESIVIRETTKLDRSSLPDNELLGCSIVNLLPLRLDHLTARYKTAQETD